MYDMYDITDLFGTEYWNYECPEGGTPKLELNNTIKEYDTYSIELLHYKDSQRSNLIIPFPHQIKFYEDWTNHDLLITFVNKNDDVSARYTIGLGHLDKEDLKVNLWGDGELLESRILTEPEQRIYEVETEDDGRQNQVTPEEINITPQYQPHKFKRTGFYKKGGLREMNDNNTTIKELTHTIQEFYTEQVNKHKTIIKPIQIDKDTLSTLIYLLHQAGKQGDITEQITTFIQEYEDEE